MTHLSTSIAPSTLYRTGLAWYSTHSRYYNTPGSRKIVGLEFKLSHKPTQEQLQTLSQWDNIRYNPSSSTILVYSHAHFMRLPAFARKLVKSASNNLPIHTSPQGI